MHATNTRGTSRAFANAMFRKTEPHHCLCSTWFERDRRHIRLETPLGRLVFELWDEAVDEAINDGFLTVPRAPRPTDADWQPHVVRYAKERGLI